MTRLIDADALIEAMNKFSNATGEDMTHGIFYAHIAPTIDAVPVIRCKDCKYGERWAPDKCYCNGFLNAWVDEDDFCAWAEPKVTE